MVFATLSHCKERSNNYKKHDWCLMRLHSFRAFLWTVTFMLDPSYSVIYQLFSQGLGGSQSASCATLLRCTCRLNWILQTNLITDFSREIWMLSIWIQSCCFWHQCVTFSGSIGDANPCQIKPEKISIGRRNYSQIYLHGWLHGLGGPWRGRNVSLWSTSQSVV